MHCVLNAFWRRNALRLYDISNYHPTKKATCILQTAFLLNIFKLNGQFLFVPQNAVFALCQFKATEQYSAKYNIAQNHIPLKWNSRNQRLPIPG